MKIGIVTFHDVVNYGGVLQAYALQRTIIERYGVQCEIIDYQNRHFYEQYKPISISLLKHPKSLVRKLGLAPSKYERRKKFRDFVEKNMILRGCHVEKGALGQISKEFDVLIVGSDQVWNLSCTGNDYSYFLDFSDDSQKRVSYAASFGMEKIPGEWKEKISELISNFDAISVRENSGKQLVKDMLKQEVAVVPDPTILQWASTWRKLQKPIENIPDKYVLVVHMGGDAQGLWNFAKKFSEDQAIVYINLAEKKIQGMQNIREASPSEWLYLIDQATTIVTNSFHGCVFSLLFHKNFYYELTPGKDSNTRLENLMRQMKIEGRNITGIDNLDDVTSINYERVEEQIEVLRNDGYNFLDTVLEKKI